jgi:hypothetical protein
MENRSSSEFSRGQPFLRPALDAMLVVKTKGVALNGLSGREVRLAQDL